MGRSCSDTRRRLIVALVALWLTALLLASATAQTFQGRGPWTSGPPDACSSLAVPCAQIDDFNLTLRVSGIGMWGGPIHGGGGVAGVTLSFYKTAEVGLSLPLAVLAGAPTIYGPPELRLRWRLGPRMGPAPFGGRWPDEEPYPKAIPAAYDLQPSPYTLSLGFGFRPLWPGVRGEGPIECSASDTGCLAEVSASATVDLRAWRLLFTAQLEAAAAGRRGELRAGGRVALDLFGTASAFGEGTYRQGIEGGRAGLFLLGGQLQGFRGATLSAYYGKSFGGLTTDHVGGAQLDVPIGLLWGALQRLSEAVDPFVAGDGWIYDDECAPLFRLGRRRGLDGVATDGGGAFFNGPTIAVGTHLWRRGDQLFYDQAGTQLFGPVQPRVGSPTPYPLDEVAHPWPDAAAARRSAEVRAQWLRRYALAPDPRRQAQCAELLQQMLAGLARAAQAPTLEEQCQRARRDQDRVMAALEGGSQDDASGAGATLIGAAANVQLVCKGGVTPQTMGALAGALRPGSGVRLNPPRSPGPATHAPPPVRNRLGKPYPVVTDLKTGQPMTFPAGPLQLVPEAQRVPWDSSRDRWRFIREWHERGYPPPPGGWAPYDVHHILPRERGGGNDFANLTPVLREVHNELVTPWWNAYAP